MTRIGPAVRAAIAAGVTAGMTFGVLVNSNDRSGGVIVEAASAETNESTPSTEIIDAAVIENTTTTTLAPTTTTTTAPAPTTTTTTLATTTTTTAPVATTTTTVPTCPSDLMVEASGSTPSDTGHTLRLRLTAPTLVGEVAISGVVNGSEPFWFSTPVTRNNMEMSQAWPNAVESVTVTQVVCR